MRILETLQAGFFDPGDLSFDHCRTRHFAADFIEGVGGYGRTFGRSQHLDLLGRLSKRRVEGANAEPQQGRLHAIDDAGPFCDEIFPFPAWALGILLLL